MNDTSHKMANKFLEMMMAKTPVERLLMGGGMFDTAKAIVTSSIKELNPSISASDLRCEIFLRFYGADFSRDKCEKILNHLRGIRT